MIGTLPGRARAATCAIALALSLGAASAAAQPAPAAAPSAPAAPPAAAPAAPAAPPAGHGQPPPGYSQPPPGYGYPPPGYGYPPPGYGYPPPGYGQPPGGYSLPPGYGQPPPGYAAPQGGYYPPQEGYYPYTATRMPVRTLPYKNGDPIPPGFAVRSRANRPLVTAGAITFGVSYLLAALVASLALSFETRDGDAQAMLFVPIAGPFIVLGTTRSSAGNVVMSVLDGAAQAGGVAMFIAGFATGEKYLQREAPQTSLAPEVLVSPGGVKLEWTF